MHYSVHNSVQRLHNLRLSSAFFEEVVGIWATHLSVPWLLDQFQEVYATADGKDGQNWEPVKKPIRRTLASPTSVGPLNAPQREWKNQWATLAGHGRVPQVKTTDRAHNSGPPSTGLKWAKKLGLGW